MPKRKLWRESIGPRGATVVVAERRWGSNVRIGAQDPKIRGTRWRSLGFRVRDAEGQLISEAVARAKAEAARLSNRLIAGEGPDASEPPAPEPRLADLIKQFERLRVLPRLRGSRSVWIRYRHQW